MADPTIDLRSGDLLPSSVPLVTRDRKFHRGQWWIPIFCANCGVEGVWIAEQTKNFAFYLCDEKHNNCAAKWSPLADTLLVPDEVFFARATAAQLEQDGRTLTADEQVEALKDDNHYLAKLAKDRPRISDR